MKKSEEFIRLEEQFRNLRDSGEIKGDILEFTEDMFGLLNKTEMRLNEMEERLLKLEDFSDILSMDLYEIQAALLQKIEKDELAAQLDEFGDFSDDDEDLDLFADMHNENCSCHDHSHDNDKDDDEDDENATFIRCPFCNTLIFLGGEEGEDITCPFCGEAFLKSDVSF